MRITHDDKTTTFFDEISASSSETFSMTHVKGKGFVDIYAENLRIIITSGGIDVIDDDNGKTLKRFFYSNFKTHQKSEEKNEN